MLDSRTLQDINVLLSHPLVDLLYSWLWLTKGAQHIKIATSASWFDAFPRKDRFVLGYAKYLHTWVRRLTESKTIYRIQLFKTIRDLDQQKVLGKVFATFDRICQCAHELASIVNESLIGLSLRLGDKMTTVLLGITTSLVKLENWKLLGLKKENNRFMNLVLRKVSSMRLGFIRGPWSKPMMMSQFQRAWFLPDSI